MSEPATNTVSAAARRPRRSSLGRNELVDAVCAVIADRGCENTRFGDVAARAGISIGSLQYVFGNREDMIIVALENRTARYVDEAIAHAGSIADPLERLRWIAGHLAAGVGTDEERRAEWLIWTEYWRAALRDDELKNSSAICYQKWTELVRDAIDSCAEADLIPGVPNSAEVAAGAVALGDGLGIQIAIGYSAMTYEQAAGMVRSWLSLQLDCAAVI